MRKRGAVMCAAIAVAVLTVLPTTAQRYGAGGVVKLEVPVNLADHAAPAQPIAFSHKRHLAHGTPCQGCHANEDPGQHMGFPETSLCMSCHTSVATGSPEIAKLVKFAKDDEEIPWARVYQVTPGVNWSHRRHLQAGAQCANCHGDVTQVDAMSQTTAVTSMASCISCHQAHEAKTTCNTCHAWPANSVPSAMTTKP